MLSFSISCPSLVRTVLKKGICLKCRVFGLASFAITFQAKTEALKKSGQPENSGENIIFEPKQTNREKKHHATTERNLLQKS